MNCFGLIETMRSRGPDIEFLQEHMDRMAKSARQLGLGFSQKGFLDAVWNAMADAWPDADMKVRVVLTTDGFDARVRPLLNPPETVSLRISSFRVLRDDPLTRHKLLCRSKYTLAQREAEQTGFWDGVLLDHTGSVAECSRANILVFLGDGFITPALENGALPGIIRRVLMDKLDVAEARISLSQLSDAKAIFVTNSLIRVAGVLDVAGTGYSPDPALLNQLRKELLHALFS